MNIPAKIVQIFTLSKLINSQVFINNLNFNEAMLAQI